MSIHTRLYDTYGQAASVVQALRNAGLEDDAIGLASPETERTADTDTNDTVGATATGTGIGAVVGGGAGALAGVGLMAIPGIGPIVAAGWLASTLAGALAGAVAGGVTGGLVDALGTLGIDKADAEVYAEGIRRGGTLVTVRAADEDDALVKRVLDQSPTLDITERNRIYREDGWNASDPALRQMGDDTPPPRIFPPAGPMP